jgi:hypothetical protein
MIKIESQARAGTAMLRRDFVTLIGGAVAWPLSAPAQQADRMRRLGVLSAGSVELTSPSMTVLPDALRGLGWIEGKNVTFERRYADNRVERLPELATELVQLNGAGLLTGACCISSRCGWNAPWKKPTIEEGRHARPRLGTTGAASHKAHPSHHCWRIYTCAGSCWDGRSLGLSEVSALAS